MIRAGCDRLLAAPEVLARRPYGLLAHGAAVTAAGRPLHLALAASAAGRPAALFGPEHGFYGVEQDMVPSADAADPWTGAPIRSLYGSDATSLRPQPEAFTGLEVLLIDLQDIGSRYYTYAATAVWAAEAACAAGLEVWVLDRPNPLGGVVVEGNLVRPGHESFVGAFTVPVRHGLTLGELMRLEWARRGLGEGLQIFSLEGWERAMLWPDTGWPWIAPSPNMPSAATAALYPGLCLVEATTLSEGRGTTRPFHLIGAPELDPQRFASRLEARFEAAGVCGLRVLPTYFRPQFQKHAGARCGGVELVITDPSALAAYRAGIELLCAAHQVCPDGLPWRTAPYEFESERPAIDLLTGSSAFRRALENGTGMAAWIDSWHDDEEAFRQARREALLYPEAP